MKKPWYKSKTVWFNALVTGSMILTGVVGLLPSTYAGAIVAINVANVVLRALTSGPINWSEDDTLESD